MSYSLEKAKSGRSTCKGCKEKIAKDEWRFGTHLEDFGTSWKKIGCITSKQLANVEAAVGSIEQVPGYPTDEDDIREIQDALATIPAKESEKKAKKAKERAIKKAEKDAEKARIKAEKDMAKADGKVSKKSTSKNASSVVKTPTPSEPLSKEEMKAETKKLHEICIKDELKLPKDDVDARVAVGTALKHTSFDRDKAYESLLEQYGSRNKGVKRAAELRAAADTSESAQKKKKNGPPQAEVEENQGLVDCFWDLSKFAFEEDNKFGGISNRKIAKALAELDFEVTSGKALTSKKNKVAGIGKSSAEKIDEFLETGEMTILEEKRGSK